MNIIHLSTSYRHNHRKNIAKCFVVHTTGDTNLRNIIDYYSSSSEGVSPHYMIDYDGTIRQFVSDDCVAYHAGYGPEQVNLYRSGWAAERAAESAA
jgi:N-acetyl-anhydromuramyl-L-alanine amidase AmpD